MDIFIVIFPVQQSFQLLPRKHWFAVVPNKDLLEAWGSVSFTKDSIKPGLLYLYHGWFPILQGIFSEVILSSLQLVLSAVRWSFKAFLFFIVFQIVRVVSDPLGSRLFDIYNTAERSARVANSVALTITAHEHTQYNRAWYIHIMVDCLPTDLVFRTYYCHFLSEAMRRSHKGERLTYYCHFMFEAMWRSHKWEQVTYYCHFMSEVMRRIRKGEVLPYYCHFMSEVLRQSHQTEQLTYYYNFMSEVMRRSHNEEQLTYYCHFMSEVMRRSPKEG